MHGDSFPAKAEFGLAARRTAGIIRRHAGARRLAVIVQFRIARRLARGGTLRIRLVHGLRTLFVAGLLLSALVLDDAVVGMGHVCLRLSHDVSKRLRAAASNVPAALAARRMDRGRCILQMHLAHRRHRRERDRDAKGEDE